jgi:hypothetical protein
VRESKLPLYPRIIKSAAIFAALLAIFYYASVPYLVNSGFAETGVGKDIFKVVVSIFGVTKETGDMAAIVNVDGNSRVKIFDLNSAKLSTYNSMYGDVVKFVAAFPDVVVESGDIYRACVVKLNDMHHYCQEGKNSSTKGPEIVDISLGKKIKRADTEKKNEVKNEVKNVLPNYSAK